MRSQLSKLHYTYPMVKAFQSDSFLRVASMRIAGRDFAVRMFTAATVIVASVVACAAIATPNTASTPTTQASTYKLDTLTVGIISADSPGEGKAAWDPVLAEWSKTLGKPVKGFYTSNYSGILNAATDGRVIVSRMSPRLALDAVSTGKVEVFAQQAWADGSVGYRSVLIVRADSGIRSLADIVAAPGRYRYGHSERQSTSGFAIPEQLFARNKISPPLHFIKMIEGTHQSSLLSVANGDVDVAAVNSSRLKKFAAKFPEESKQIRVIWESDPIPDVMWLIRKDLDPTIKTAIKNTVLSYGKGPRGKEQLTALKKVYDLSGFVPAANPALWPMLELARLADRMSAERGQYPSQAERERRLNEVDRLYADLAKALGIR